VETETKIRQIKPDITVVEISGRLTLGNLVLPLEESIRRMIDEGSRKLVVDLTSLSYIDSAGIGMLVGCIKHMDRNHGRLRIEGAQGVVAEAFGTVHLERIAALDADLEASCRQLSAESAAA
jgi:anti-sigma B factor antagonist